MFGSGVTTSDLTGYKNSDEASGMKIDTAALNFGGTTGILINFDYTFAVWRRCRNRRCRRPHTDTGAVGNDNYYDTYWNDGGLLFEEK